MSNKEIVNQLLNTALMTLSVTELRLVVLEYFYPSFSSTWTSTEENKRILNDICLIWITCKGLDREYIYPYQQGIDFFDGIPIEKIQSQLVTEFFQSKDADFKSLTVKLSPYLDLPLFHFTEIYINYRTKSPLHFEDTNSSYLFSANNRERSKLIDFDDDENAVEPTEEERKKIEQDEDKLRKQKQQHILDNDVNVLPIVESSTQILARARLKMNYLTLKDILCACHQLKVRHVGLRFYKMFEIIGLVPSGSPIISVFFDDSTNSGHIFMD